MDQSKTYSYDEAYSASLAYFGGDELAARVWVNKYAMKDSYGNIYSFNVVVSSSAPAIRIFSIDGEELGSFYCDFTYTPEYFSDGLLLIALSEEEFGYIDRTGKLAIPSSPELDYYSNFSEGLAAVISDNGYGYIGTDGNIAIDTKYDSVSDFYNQFAVVVEDGTEKYINHAGEVIYEKP